VVEVVPKIDAGADLAPGRLGAADFDPEAFALADRLRVAPGVVPGVRGRPRIIGPAVVFRGRRSVVVPAGDR
jgi:hypothetical protein